MKGFTLIELLVAVLIISILTAVALPQYQKAVAKARIARVLPILKEIQEAEERFYMANGFYTTDKTLLDIEVKDNMFVFAPNKVICYPTSGVGVARTWERVDGYNDANAPAPGKFFTDTGLNWERKFAVPLAPRIIVGCLILLTGSRSSKILIPSGDN